MAKVLHSRRFVGYFIDILISLPIAIILVNNFHLDEIVDYMFALMVMTSVVFLIYVFIFYLLFNGLSIGRMIINTKIVNKDGSRMSVLTCFIRAGLQCLFVLGVVNIFYMIFNKDEESFFEKATETKNVVWIKSRQENY